MGQIEKYTLKISGLLCLLLFTSCKNDKSDDLLPQIIRVAFESTFDKDLNGAYFYLDTIPEVSNIDLSFDGLRSSSNDEGYLNQVQKFENEIIFSSGKDWINLINENEVYQVGFNSNDPNLSGFFSVTEPVVVSKDKIWVYFELFCGNVCSKGLIIEVNKLDGKWETAELTKVWGD